MTDIKNEENNAQEEDFAALLDQYEADTPSQISIGDKVSGKIVHRSKESLHVDVGTRSEAILSLEDPRTAEFNVDDTIEAYVKRSSGEIQLSLDPILGHGDFSSLLEAYDQGTPIEGTVIGVNKGGFEVNIGGSKCFCPISQLALERIETPQTWIGTTRDFKVIELDHKGKSAVVSHRQLIIDEENRKRDELRAKIHEGVVLEGKVVEIMKFGAFIDLGGLRGLLHISELAHYKVMKVEDILHTGQELEVKVLSIETDEKGRERFSLSRKALIENPWHIHHFQEGQVIKATPVRTAPFGLFVRVVEGIEGLVPKRFLRKEGQIVELEDVPLNQEEEFAVIEINQEDQRLTLAFKGWNERPESALQAGEKLKAKVVKIIPAGLLVQAIDDPARGLVPKRFLDKMNHKKLTDTYPEGHELDLVLESIDERGRYTFELLDKKNDIASETIEKYADKESFAHNPFADFFNK